MAFVRFDLGTGELSPIIDPEQDLPNNRFNDGKVDPEGRLWAGTMGIDEAPNVGSLYRLNRNLSADKLFDQVSVSNGMVWTSDQKTFYYIDSPTRRVDVFDCDMAAGTLSNRRTAFELPEGMGYPDGMCIDDEGMLWVALWQGLGRGAVRAGRDAIGQGGRAGRVRDVVLFRWRKLGRTLHHLL